MVIFLSSSGWLILCCFASRYLLLGFSASFAYSAAAVIPSIWNVVHCYIVIQYDLYHFVKLFGVTYLAAEVIPCGLVNLIHLGFLALQFFHYTGP